MRQNYKTRRLYKLSLIVVALLFASLFIHCNKQADKASFRFVFMTDIHVQPENQGEEGFKAAIAKVNALNPDFVITGGDLIMDALAQEYGRADSLYNLFIETAGDFKMPVHHCIGNHELFGLYERSGVSPDHPEYGKKMFASRLNNGKRYRSFDFGDWHFILLDGIGTTPERTYIGKIDSVQISWLRDDLKRVGPERPIVMAIHIPFFTVATQIRKGSLVANNAGSVINNAKEVWEIFRPYNVQLVLQGHLHIVEEIIWKNTHFVTGGAVSGAWWKGSYWGFPEGFVVVDVNGDDFTWHYETYGWEANQ